MLSIKLCQLTSQNVTSLVPGTVGTKFFCRYCTFPTLEFTQYSTNQLGCKLANSGICEMWSSCELTIWPKGKHTNWGDTLELNHHANRFFLCGVFFFCVSIYMELLPVNRSLISACTFLCGVFFFFVSLYIYMELLPVNRSLISACTFLCGVFFFFCVSLYIYGVVACQQKFDKCLLLRMAVVTTGWSNASKPASKYSGASE